MSRTRCLLFSLCLFFSQSVLAATVETITVSIDGVKDELLNNVRALLSIEQLSKDVPASITSSRLKRAHEQAIKDINVALQPFGYYQVKVVQTLSKKEENKKNIIKNETTQYVNWTADYQITLGPSVLIEKYVLRIDGEGKDNDLVKEAIATNRLKMGDVLNHAQYATLKKSLIDSAYSEGYLDATFLKSEMRVDVKRNKADIHLVFSTGERYFFGDIIVKQNVLDDSFIKRFVKNYIDAEALTPFRTQRLLALNLGFSNTDYFSHADLVADKKQAINQRIPVTITATENPRRKYTSSLGYGTDTGPRIGLGLLSRRVNSQGHQFKSNIRLSAVDSQFSAQYKMPIDNVSSEYLDITATVSDEKVNDVSAVQYAFGSSINKNWRSGLLRTSVSLEQETYSFGDEDPSISNLLIPSISYTQTNVDDLFFARKGYSLYLGLHGGLKSVLSETTFFQANINIKTVTPLSERSRFLARVEYGTTMTNNFDGLPPSQRFFTGGAQTLRGYGFKSVSPVNAQNDNIGGQSLVVGSLEVDRLFWGNYGFAAFYDVGDVTTDTDFILKKSYGLGFRYRSPLGMIRLDIARPQDDPDNDFRLHLSIGSDL